MMHRRFRRILRDERGHAIVLGAIGMLIMALVVMASVSLGDAVYQKIKLQDAADAQSYSVAVKMARAYNFFAYTNRTMVVHYNAMLTMLSYASHAFYLDEGIGRAARWLSWVPYVGQILAIIGRIIRIYKQFADGAAIVVTWALQALNWGLWLAQEAMLYSTYLEVWDGRGAGPINNTDPRAETKLMDALGGLLNQFNAMNFLHPVEDALHDYNPFSGTDGTPFGTIHRGKLLGNNRLDNVDFAKYRLLMGDIVNGHRLERTAVGRGPIILGRRWSFSIPYVIRFNKVADTQLKSFKPNFEGDRKDQLFSMEDFVIKTWSWRRMKWRTKFTFHIRITADRRGGYHEIGRVRSTPHQHQFLGISPFISSDTSFAKPWTYHFGQPCNLIALNKNVEGSRQAFQVKSKLSIGSHQGEVDLGFHEQDALLGFLGKTGGMVAVSVGRAIYHRPGDWREEPNFFNPLWTARLAPARSHWQPVIVNLVPGFLESNVLETVNY